MVLDKSRTTSTNNEPLQVITEAKGGNQTDLYTLWEGAWFNELVIILCMT